MSKSRLIRSSYAGLALALFALFGVWVLHARESLWLDELQTFWVIKDSFAEVIRRAFNTQGFTPLYYIVAWLWRPIFGGSEWALRLPSLLFTGISALAVYAVAERLWSTRAASFAAVVFVSLDQVLDAALIARPYALALMCSVVSLWFLVRWVGRGLRRDQYAYLGFFLLSIYAHYLFSCALVVHVLYVVVRRKLNLISLKQGIITAVYLAIGLIPLTSQARLMMEKKEYMSIAPMPLWADLVISLLPWVSILVLALSLFFAMGVVKKGERIFRHQRAHDYPLLAWLLLFCFFPPVGLFVLSHALGTSVFVGRYFLWSAPGFALLCGYLFEFIQNERVRDIVIVFSALFCLTSELTKERFQEDWRSAISDVRSELTKEPAQVLLYSGVVESAREDWMNDENKQGQFSSPLSYYEISSVPTLLPLFVARETGPGSYWSEKILPGLSQNSRLILLCLNNLSWSEGEVSHQVCDAIDDDIVSVGYQRLSRKTYQRVAVVVYSKGNLNNLSDLPR